ncbi:MAG: hypothetical protein ACI4LI_00450, partial [Candidatus Fimenecus sp.]
KLNTFDLNEFIKAIHFDEMKVPSFPFQLPTSKTYFGLKEMMDSELDFLKATVLSKSMVPVIMYNGGNGARRRIPEKVDVRHGYDAEKGIAFKSNP